MAAFLKRAELIREALRQWQLTSENYRTLVIKYRFYIQERRTLGIGLRTIKESEIAMLPDIAFLRLLDEGSATEYLENLSDSEIARLIGEIVTMRETNFTYRSLKSHISDSEYLCDYKLKRKSGWRPASCGVMDPHACKGNSIFNYSSHKSTEE